MIVPLTTNTRTHISKFNPFYYFIDKEHKQIESTFRLNLARSLRLYKKIIVGLQYSSLIIDNYKIGWRSYPSKSDNVRKTKQFFTLVTRHKFIIYYALYED